jgi:hypothetical protein
VAIKVGPSHTPYVILKAFLVYYSDYFKTALERPWKEAEDRMISLDDIEPGVFNLFINWLYTQNLPADSSEWFEAGGMKDTPPRDQWINRDMLRLKLYVFADRFLIPTLRKQLSLQIANDTNISCSPHPEVLLFAAENIPENDSIYDFFVDTTSRHFDHDADGEDNKQLWDSLPPGFVLRCLKRIVTVHEWYHDDDVLDACNYHYHESVAEQEACKNGEDIDMD